MKVKIIILTVVPMFLRMILNIAWSLLNEHGLLLFHQEDLPFLLETQPHGSRNLFLNESLVGELMIIFTAKPLKILNKGGHSSKFNLKQFIFQSLILYSGIELPNGQGKGRKSVQGQTRR